jgi:hypothetical protein
VGTAHFETTTGPVAVGGRTITLVARTSRRSIGSWFSERARPTHIEILDGDGRRHVVPVRDYQRLATALIAAVAGACVIGTRVIKRTRSMR